MIGRETLARARQLGFTPAIALGVIGFHIGSTVFEGVGIGMILPVFQYLQAGEDVAALAADSELWRRLVAAYGWAGLPISLSILLATSFAAVLLRQLFVYARLVFLARVRLDAIARLQTEMFRRYLTVRLAYHERQRVGATVNDFGTQVELAIDHYLQALDFIGFAILFAVYTTLLFSVSPLMASAALATLGATAWALRGLFKESRKVGYETVAARQSLSAFLAERLNVLRLIRLSGAEGGETAEADRLADNQRSKLFQNLRLGARLGTAVEPIVAGVAMLLLYFGVKVAKLGIGGLGLFMVVLIRLLPIVKHLMQTHQAFVTTEAAVAAVLGRLDDLSRHRERAVGAMPFERLREGIRLDRVTFRYPERSRPALEGVSFDIPAGSFVALVGPSGGGKSTLVDLLPRLREPTSGRVLFDGRPAAEFALESLRAAIAYVPQAPLILNTSPLEHIRYGCPSASLEEVREAARRAGADEFIAQLPGGYETPLGEGGIELSGGQRQRLDLARALLQKAQLLILDEPTSHLDADAERLFRETLVRLRALGEMTIIVIGHHLATVTAADRIVVLEGGRLTEIGTHAELVRRHGWYANAYRQQQLLAAGPPLPADAGPPAQ